MTAMYAALKLMRAVLLLGALVYPALAAPNKVFTVGVEDYPNFLPYSEYQNSKYSGLGKDILDAFAHEHGYTFDYQVYPLKRRDNLFVLGKLDLIFPDNPEWIPDLKQGKNIAYAQMLEFTDGVLVLKKNRGRGVGAIKVLGTPLGFTPFPFLEQIRWGAVAVEESISYDALYDKLAAGRVDGAYMNTEIAQHYFAKVPKFQAGNIIYDADLPHATGYWCLSSMAYPDIVKEFKEFMEKNKPLVDELKRRYQFNVAP
jgi:ABC-type amino acid transport substrate-binding protein